MVPLFHCSPIFNNGAIHFSCYNSSMSIHLPKIFLDSGDPLETKKAKGLLGHVDGQTTNPSLVAKNPEITKYLNSGKKLSEKELLTEYKTMVQAIGTEIAGPISAEVYADWDTKAETMLEQAQEMNTWGTNIYVKFPTIPEGVKAAHEFVKLGGHVNMTLVFDQQQAGAIFSATRGTTAPAFISPFIGRWDDKGYDGMDLIRNIQKMYRKYNNQLNAKKSHVEVLAASIRNMDHFYCSIFLNVDIMTVPLKLIQEWVHDEKWMPDEHYRYNAPGLKSILYQDTPLKEFTAYDISRVEGSLLDEGLVKFVKDWKALLA